MVHLAKLLITNLTTVFTDIVKHTTRCNNVRCIHNVNIQPLGQALPSALESSKGTLNGHPCSAQTEIEVDLVVCEFACIGIPLHNPTAQGVGWITQEHYGDFSATDYFTALRC